MSKKLTEKSLEKKLHNMGTEELIQIIMSLYRSNKSVEQSINLQIIGDAYHDAIVAAGQDEELYKLWKDRLESVLHDFAGFGWGWRSIYMRNIIRYHGYRRITDEQESTQSAGCS